MGAPAASQAGASTQVGSSDVHRRLRQPKIDGPLVLVVDDDPFNLMVASQRLSFMRIQPLLGADGADAVVIACGLRLDLILMDLQMPVLDGFAATAKIRQFEREHSRRRVPVVAYTSTPTTGDLTRLRDSGFDAVLEKPAGVRAMRECVTRWCLPADHKATPARTGKVHAMVRHRFSTPTSSPRGAT